MKNLLIASICFIPLVSMGQNLPIGYYSYVWEDDLFDWRLEREERYLYNENDSLIQNLSYLPDDPRALEKIDTRIIYKYNNDGSNLSSVQQYMKGNEGVWVNQVRQTWFTDENGYYGWLTEDWEGEEWVPFRHYRYKTSPMDSFLILDAYLDYWKEGIREPAYHDSSHLNLAGNEIEKWSLAWDGTDWVSITHWETDYSQYGDIIRKRQDNLAQNPPNYIEQRWLISYDSRGDIWSKTHERRTAFKPDWEDLGSDAYRYDAQRRKTREERTFESPIYWRSQYRREFEYRGDTILERYYNYQLGQSWQLQTQTQTVFSTQFPSHKTYQRIDSFKNGSWRLFEEKIYQFTTDEQGQLHEISLDLQTPQASKTLGVLRVFQTYDDRGRVLSNIKHYFDLNNEQYVPSLKRVWVYNDEQLINQAANQFVIYPQAVSGKINLQFIRQQSAPSEIHIFDLNGKVLLAQALGDISLDSGLVLEPPTEVSGLYFLRVLYEDGSSRTQKWILGK